LRTAGETKRNYQQQRYEQNPSSLFHKNSFFPYLQRIVEFFEE
jgi:hypothetical protein